MKKILLITFAFGILLAFTGCDWIEGLFNIGTSELEVDSFWITEDSGGRLTTVDISIENTGTRDAEGLEISIVFSTDENIDVDNDIEIYDEQIYIESEDFYETNISWSTIASYISDNNVVIPVQEGYLGIIVDPYGSIEEDNGEWDNISYDSMLTSVPGIDWYENDDESNSATDIETEGWSVTKHLFALGGSDSDCVYFDVGPTANGYIIETEPVGSTSTDTFIEVYNNSMVKIGEDDNSGSAYPFSYFDLFNPEEEIHYVVVTGATSSDIGLYTLTITEY